MPRKKSIPPVKSLTEWDKIGQPPAPLHPLAEDWSGVALPSPPEKAPVYLKLEADVLAWYRAQGKGYQQFINDVLRSYMESKAR